MSDSKPNPKSEAEAHPGAALKAARIRRGASVASVATSAHLDQSLVEALEEGRYDAFHAPAYVYGYVRSYARFVGLDGDALVEQLDVSWEDSPRNPDLPRPLKPPLPERTQRYLGVLFGGLVAVVLIAAAVVLWMAGWSSDWLSWISDGTSVETSEAVDAPPAEDATAATNLPSAPPITPVGAAPSAVGTNDDPAATTGPDATSSADSEYVVPDAAESIIEPRPAAGAEAVDDGAPDALGTDATVGETDGAAGQDGFALLPPDELALVFDDSSWVEVEDASGEIIHADLGNRGESYSIYGQAPFRIVIGYAPGVQIAFNGDPVALTPHTQSSVARLVVGL